MDNCSPLLLSRIEKILEGYSSGSEGRVPSASLFFRPVEIELQNGMPVCGFTSLIAAVGALKKAEESMISLEEAVEAGKGMGKTKRGEMFSADWMVEIASCIWPEIPCELASFLDPTAMVKSLANVEKCFLLVPYDCDKNFEPCLRGGQSAHWAVVAGFLLIDRECKKSEESSADKLTWFNDFNKLERAEPGNLFLIAFHGKSRHPGVWSYESLRLSNAQLDRPDIKRMEEFQLPEEGIQLSGRCVVLGRGPLSEGRSDNEQQESVD